MTMIARTPLSLNAAATTTSGGEASNSSKKNEEETVVRSSHTTSSTSASSHNRDDDYSSSSFLDHHLNPMNIDETSGEGCKNISNGSGRASQSASTAKIQIPDA